MIDPALKKLPLKEIYKNLYPWSSLNEFVQQLRDTVAYKSDDNSLIALNKPFGVGTFARTDRNVGKQNQDKLLYQLCGHPRYSISDALDPLSQEFNSSQPYQIIKGIDRYMSGLTLVSNDPVRHQADFKRSVATSRINKEPPYGFRAITCGYPKVKSNKLYERVGVQLIEIDELGDHKEPLIVPNAGSSYKHMNGERKLFQAELEVKKINRADSVSLVELFVSAFRWDFPRCYISSKTSFILGDVRFSKRIREVLGKQIQVSAFRSSHRYEDSYEPLNSRLQKLLGESKNTSIPLMLDLHVMRLKNFDRKLKKDLIIRSPHMPAHFALTAHRLDLLDDSSCSEDDVIENRSNTVAL